MRARGCPGARASPGTAGRRARRDRAASGDWLQLQCLLIVSGGFNIWPAELETVIADHPDVVEVAVSAIPHERWGETPMAVCTITDGATVTEQDIIDLVTETLGSYKKPSRVDLIRDPLPKSPVGKLLRKQLRDPHWAGQERRVGGG